MYKKILMLFGSFLCVSSFYAMDPSRLANPIFSSIKNNRVDEVKSILEKNPDVVKKTDKDGNTPLMIAVQYMKSNDMMIIEMLLAKMDEDTINHLNNEGMTALMFAANYGYLTICEKLIAKDADVNIIGGSHWTALQVAAYNNHAAIVQLLLEKKAICSESDFEWAQGERHIENNILNLLKEHCGEKKPVSTGTDKDLKVPLANLSHSLNGLGQALKKK